MWIMLVAVICFLVAYLTYARKLTSKWGMDDNQLTPAHEKQDGIDYVPAKNLCCWVITLPLLPELHQLLARLQQHSSAGFR